MRLLIFALLMTSSIGLSWGQERGSDPHVRELMQQALDDALHDQVKQLFAVWLKDSGGQPERAASGIRRAVSAYRHAVQAIETGKLAWKPRRFARQRGRHDL